MTDAVAINPNLFFYRLTDHIGAQPQGTRLDRHQGRGIELPTTAAVLRAARLTARAELEELGLNETTSGNPIDAILMSDPTPLFSQLATAIARASRAGAFDAPTLPPTHPTYIIGDQVRILRDSNEIPTSLIGLTARIIFTNLNSNTYEIQPLDGRRGIYTVDHDNLEPVR